MTTTKPEFKVKHISDEGVPPLDEMMAVGDELERREEQPGKTSEASQELEKKRSLNYLYMPTWLFNWLVKESNQQGMKLEQFTVNLLRDQYRNWQEPNEDEDVGTFISWARQKSDAISDAYNDAYAIAVNCKNHPTEENTKLLFKSCDKLGIDPEELLNKVQKDVYADLVVQYRSDPDSKMNRCVKWVIDFCRDREDIPSRVFNEAGGKAGYTRQMLHSARNKVGIQSTLRGGDYYLVMPKSAKVLHGRVSDE